ncbi:MAG: translocation/assembly module TamB domain-containing protein, partial [Kofleriaceae bacterium]
PDKRPAITVKTLKVAVGILPLLSHQARVLSMRAEDVDVDLRRDAEGGLQIANLMIPGPKGTWSVALPRIEVRRAHVRFDAGSEVMNFDGLEIDARAHMPHDGPLDAGVELQGAWRERGSAPLLVRTVLHSDDRGLSVPYLVALAGDVTVVGHHVTKGATLEGKPPVIGGTVFVDATAAAVARLVPTLHLPADLQVSVTARPIEGQSWTDLAVVGKVDQTPVTFNGSADLESKHARGELTTGTLELTKLSGGKIEGTGAANVVFDVRPGGAKSLPIATATIKGWGELAGYPKAAFTIGVTSAGERARAVIDADGSGVKARISTTVHTVGDLLEIEDTKIFAETADPQRASGGKAPVHGTLKVDLRASGQIKPTPSLAVAGTIDGRHLRMQDLSVAQLHVTLDAVKLPSRPYGKAHVQIIDLVRGDLRLGALTVDAADRADGKVAVQVRSHPIQNPWLVDADLLVTPPAGAGAASVVVDIQSHHVRAGNGSDWTGRGGHVEIGAERVVVRDFQSASAMGKLALGATYDRAGRTQGNLDAKVDAIGIALDTISSKYHGKVDAHVAVTRKAAKWDGDVQIDGIGISIDPKPTMMDTHAKLALHGNQLSLTADATSLGLGDMKLALDLDAPARIEDPRAWKKLGRDAIRTGKLTLQGVELRKAAELAGLEGVYGGRLDGDIQLSATTIGGRIEAKNLEAPALRGLTGVNATLDLSQPSANEITPTVTVTAEGFGQLQAEARLQLPDRQFDPAAWQQLGRAALQGATVHADNIQVDPAMLDRLGIQSEMRAKVSVAVELSAEGKTLEAKLDVGELRGAPIDQPLDIHAGVSIGDQDTQVTVTVKTKNSPLLELAGKVPLNLTKLMNREEKSVEGFMYTPIAGTLTLAKIEAVKLLAVFGRSEITGGVIDGKVEIAGTLGAPTVEANLTAIGLKVPPGGRNKPVRTVDKLTITGSWDGTIAKLNLDGTESNGGKLVIAGEARPDALADASLTIKATKFDLVPLLVFLPGPAGGAAGTLDANLTMKGLDLRTMQLAGEVHLLDARIPIAPQVGTLRRAKIDAIIADHQIRLALDGKMGKGTIVMTGAIALDGAAPNGGNAKITLRKISPIGSVEPEITADITAALTRSENQWKANLVVNKGFVLVSSDRGEALKPVGAPTDMTFANGKKVTRRPMDKEAPTNPIFVVDITLNSTRVESEEFRGVLKGKLEITADGKSIGLVGGIAADSGDLDLFGHRYYVERAGVSFDGSIDPLLDVRITHDFPDVTTITQVRGRVSAPELVMSADPGTYSQGQLLGFLLGGDPAGDPADSSATSKVEGAGASFVANKLGGYVKQALPIDIDVLRYETATASGSAAVTVGTWVTHTLFLAYKQHLGSRPDENSSEGNLEYWLTRRLMLDGTAGDRGYNGIDLLWRKRY